MNNGRVLMSSDRWSLPPGSVWPFFAGAATASLMWYAGMILFQSRGGRDNDDDPADDMSIPTHIQHIIMSSVDDLTSRIGELPHQIVRRTRWPWQTLRRNKSADAIHKEGEDEESFYTSDEGAETPSTLDPEDKSGFCIGSIFGLDVGGTLAKLVYFEETKHNNHPNGMDVTGEHISRHGRHFSYAGDGLSEADLQSLHDLAPDRNRRKSTSSVEALKSRSIPEELESVPNPRDLRRTQSDEFPATKTSPTNGEIHPAPQQRKKGDTGRSISEGSAAMPKVHSMLDFQFTVRDREEALDRFYSFAKHLDTYARNSVRDHRLSFYSRELGGYFHFIHFETRRMRDAMDLIRKHNLQRNIRQMGATGGGAHKFADDFQDELGISMKREGELESLVAGMQFVLSTVVGECYTFRPPHEKTEKDKNKVKNPLDEDANDDYGDYFGVKWANDSEESASDSGESIPQPPPSDKTSMKIDDWWWSRKVQRDSISYSSTYPYLVVTIGTGVSILRVDGPRKHERISGSTIGGGTYWGLIRLLTSFEQFEDVIRLAERGDPSKVDMMVGDIYGGNSEALDRLGLRADLVASSFGKLVAKDDPAEGLTEEDLARALLLMVTNNIGQVAYLNAELHKTERIYFVGNFLRQNRLSQRRLSFAIDYWSKGKQEALFLEHEGYLGSLGAFLLSQGVPHQETNWKNLQSQHSNPLPEEGTPHRHSLRRRKTVGSFSVASSD